MRKIIFVCVFAFLFPIVCFAEEEAVKEKYIASTSLAGGTGGAGKTSSEMLDLMNQIMKLIEERTGIKIELQIVSSWRTINYRLFKGSIDFTFMGSSQYLLAKDYGILVKPWLTAKVQGNTSYKACIFVNKKSKIKNIKQLKGKSIAMNYPPVLSKNKYARVTELAGYEPWLLLKSMLVSSGYNGSIDKYFSTIFLNIPSVESQLYAILFGKVDAAFTIPEYIPILVKQDKRFNELMPISCSEEIPNAFLTYRDGINSEVIKKLENFFLNAHKTKEGKKLIDVLGGEAVVKVNDSGSIYDNLRKFWKTAEEKGWIKEIEELAKKIEAERQKKKKFE